MNRAVRAYPATPQTEDPAFADLCEFMAWAGTVRHILRQCPDWHAGDALRWLAQQETPA